MRTTNTFGVRTALAGLAAGALLLSGLAPSAQARPATGTTADTPAAAAAAKPNFVFVLTDDLDTSLLRFMPHVRNLAKQGTSFSRYTVSDTLCCPSRASMLTGRYPHSTGIFTNTAPDGGYAAFKAKGLENETWGVALQRAGYHTGFMGKYLNGYDPRSKVVPPGWNTWAVAGNGYPEFNYTLNVDGSLVRYGHRDSDYLTDVLARRSTAFIAAQAKAGKPFALEVATFAPHAPFTPAPRDAKKFPHLTAPRSAAFNEKNIADKPGWLRNHKKLTKAQIRAIDRDYRKRARSVVSVDRLVREIREALADTGQARNTYVVFSSDNGFHLGQHRLRSGKQTAFRTDVVVPLIVDGPGVGHRTVSALAQNVDLAPTFADLAGTSLPKADGRSMAKLWHGTKVSDWRTAALVEHHGPNTDPADPDRQRDNPPTYAALLTKNATYVQYVDGSHEFYNDRTDPQQLRNAYRSLSPTRKTDLTERLAALTSCTGPVQCR